MCPKRSIKLIFSVESNGRTSHCYYLQAESVLQGKTQISLIFINVINEIRVDQGAMVIGETEYWTLEKVRI